MTHITLFLSFRFVCEFGCTHRTFVTLFRIFLRKEHFGVGYFLPCAQETVCSSKLVAPAESMLGKQLISSATSLTLAMLLSCPCPSARRSTPTSLGYFFSIFLTCSARELTNVSRENEYLAEGYTHERARTQHDCPVCVCMCVCCVGKKVNIPVCV